MNIITQKDIGKILDPVIVRKNLMLCSLYLSAYELLKSSIIDSIRGFFVVDLGGKEIEIEKDCFKKEVKGLHKNLFRASCLWLEKNEVITSDEVEEIKKITDHRKEIAHELPRLLVDSALDVNLSYLLRIKELLQRIDTWWIKEVEIPINPDYDDAEFDLDDIRSGRMILLDHIISTALGDYANNGNSQRST